MHAAVVMAMVLFPGVTLGAADLSAPRVAPAPRLHDVTVVDRQDAVLVRVKTAGPAKFRAELVESPYRLVVDLEDTIYAWRKTPLNVGREPVRRVRGGQYQEDVARVVVELTRKVGYVVRADDDGLVIVVPTVSSAPAGIGRIVPINGSVNGLRVINAAAPAAPEPGPSVQEPPTEEAAKPQAVKPQTADKPEPTVAPRPQPSAEPAKVPAPIVPNPVRIAQTATARPATRPPVTLEFKDADIVSLLRVLATEAGRNIVIGEDVKGKMSISLRNVPWELALQTILEARGLEAIQRDGILRIATREQLTKEAEATIRMRDVSAKLAESTAKPELRGPLREETIRLYYTDAEEVAKTLQGILGIEAEGARVARLGGPIAGPIAEPPFSQLYGPPPPPPPPGATAPQAPPEVLFKGLTIRAHKPTNTLFLRLYQADLERVKQLIRESLDIPLPQVKIEARMEILDRSALEQIGIQWGGAFAAPLNSTTVVGRGLETAGALPLIPGGIPVQGFTPGNTGLTLANALPVSAATGLPLGGNLVNLPISALPTTGALPAAGLAFGIVGTRFNVNLALQALATQNKTRTLARPEVVTVENAKAVISLGEEIPYATVSSAGTQIQFKEALLKLEVTPTVIREGDITKIKMVVVVENNSRGAVVNLGSAGAPPAINRRKAETQVLMREGERLIIGGVTTNVDIEETRKVPIFGDIPLLGWLFKQRERSETGRELVVFLTPTVFRNNTERATSAVPTRK
ncbi:MAG TPA: type IV pilus secretin PilQ [Methylomirabilota bacterium]|nr:type IV pilus secretin PilQ [Methylomirabilota bacterium]